MNEQNQAATPPKRTRPKLLRIASIKPCLNPQRIGEAIVFKMVFVTMDSKEVTQECTSHVFNSIKKNRPDMNKKVDFILTIDATSNIITDWSPAERASAMQGFQQENEDGSKKEVNLILERSADGNVHPVNVPENCTAEMLDAATAAIYESQDLRPGTVINDRLSVDECNRNQAGERIVFQIHR